MVLINIIGDHSLRPATTILGVEFFWFTRKKNAFRSFFGGGKKIGPYFFHGQKIDVTSKNPWDPKFAENSLK